MAKKTKEQTINDLNRMFWADVTITLPDLLSYFTRAELERIAKKIRKDLER
jgi:hypothetical protein